MLIDGRGLPNATTLDADVCVIGAGPAGLALARELAERGASPPDIVLLESGGERADPDADALGDGDLAGDDYSGLRETRHRQVGGTSCIWNTRLRGGVGAKFVP